MKERITRREIDIYKQQILDKTVLVGSNEAAAILSIHPRTLKRRVDEGRIKAYNDNGTNRNLRFLASDLRDYVRGMRVDISAELESVKNF
jgi:excisionase family DNA binding protein